MVPRVAGRQVDDHARTRHDYDELLLSRVLPTFETVELRRITPPMVRAWVADVTTAGLSTARITKAMHLLRSSLGQAVADEILVRNPAAQVTVARARRRDQLFLAVEQVSTLAEAAGAARTAQGSSFAGWPTRGMRWGETVALERPAVDVRRRRVRITEAISTVGGRTRVGDTKSPKSGTITMPAFLADRVAAHLVDVEPDGLVYTAPQGGSLRSSNWRRRVWGPRSYAGIDPGLRIHDLRHTAAA